MYHYCSHGTLLHNGFQNFLMNNCYYNQDLYSKSLQPCPNMILLCKYRHPPTQCSALETSAVLQLLASALSIFGAVPFGRWVITHSLTVFNFHDHRPTVKMKQHPSRYLIGKKFCSLALLKVHPSSPVLLTKNGPQRVSIRPPISH